jgi:uncharacterized protein YkwD
MRRFFTILLLGIILILPVSTAAGQVPDYTLGEAVTAISNETPSSPGLNFSGCTRVDVAAVNASFEQQVVELVNQQRWANGQLPPFKHNTLLDLAARYHALDMRDDNYFDHATYDGTSLVCDFATRVGKWYTGWNFVAENIAGGYSTPESVISGWMGSSGHRANILHTETREIGVGYYNGGYWNHYWVQDFGRIGSVYPVVINREAAQTDNYQVSLYLYGEGTFTQMRLRNDNGAWGNWITFTPNLSWNLNQVKGTRTVTVELKKADNSVTTSSDEIYLTNGAELGGLPGEIYFIYEQSSAAYYPAWVTLLPQNSGGTMALTWTATKANNWVILSQLNGLSPNGATQVTISGLNTSIPGDYSSSITITVTNPAGTLNSPVNIPVHVAVVTDLNNFVFMPSMKK